MVKESIRYGHQVTGLARSAESAAKLQELDASAHPGSIEDLERLKFGAAQADGVIHCAFNHDFSRFAESGHAEQRAIEALGSTLRGSSRPLVVTSGVALITPGRVTTEEDPIPPDYPIPRNPESTALAFAKDGVRASIVRLSPVTHGQGGGGFAGLLVKTARETRISAYVGAGENCWPAVHHRDTAQLYRLALERGTAGHRYHAVAEEGIATRDIAAAIGRALNLPTVSLSADAAASHFGSFKDFARIDTRASSALTRSRLPWSPTHLDLLADLAHGLKS